MLRRILVMPIVYGLLVIFAACAQPGQLVTRTATPLVTATLAATLAPTDMPPVATRTSTTMPTDTPPTPTDPTTTSGPSATVAAPSETPTPTPAAPTSTPILALLDTQTTTTASPEGTWVAVSEAGFPVTKNGAACAGCGDQYFVRFTVRRADGSQSWTPVAEWRPMGLGYTTPAALHWSADGAALYFTNLAHPDGCGYFSNNGSDLLRLDLDTGAVAELAPAGGYYLVLSPDETQVAYLAYGQRGLVVRSLANSTERAYPLADLGGQAGAVVWAPDASALALTIRSEACGGNHMTQMVIEVKVADGARRVLVPPDDRQLTTVAWPSLERLGLMDGAGSHWVLNPVTGQLTPEG